MGEGLVRATASTILSRSKNVTLVRQPDPSKIVVKCQACGIEQTYQLPSEIPAMTKWLKQVEKAHSTCAKPAEDGK
jgi:hypothetical protein